MASVLRRAISSASGGGRGRIWPRPRSQTLTGGKRTNVGLGWRIDVTKDGKRYYHHGGAITGGRAFLLVVPDQSVSVALLANLLARYDQNEALAIARRFASGGASRSGETVVTARPSP